MTSQFLFLLLVPGVGETSTQPALIDAPVNTIGQTVSRGPSMHWGDYNGDGALDVFVATPGGQDRLYQGSAEQGFVESTKETRLQASSGSLGALWSDIDSDGDLDLLTWAGTAPSKLWINDGQGGFDEMTGPSGLATESGDLALMVLDINGDGKLDLQRRTVAGDRLYKNEGRGSFSEVTMADLLVAPAPFATTPLALVREPKQTPDKPSAREERSGGGTAAVVNPGAITVGSIGPQTASAASFSCASAVEDAAFPGNCVGLSTIPTLGKIYPLSTDFNVSPSGNVGIGTANPTTKLDVDGILRVRGTLISTLASGAPLAVASSFKVFNLNTDLLDGLDSTQFTQLGQSIDGSEINDSSITAADLAVDSVDTAMIVADAVTTSELANSSVTSDKLAFGSVTNTKLVNFSVSSGKLENLSVTSDKLAIGSVTNSKIGPSSVNSEKLTTESVTSAKLAFGSVTSDKLATFSVTNTKLAVGSVSNSNLAVNSVFTSNILDGTIGNADINFNAAIDGSKIVPAFGTQTVSSRSTPSVPAAKGQGLGTQSMGYLGVQGLNNYDGNAGVNWSGKQIGVGGVSMSANGGSNIGVAGHSTGIGVRGITLATSTTLAGVEGIVDQNSSNAAGVRGTAPKYGVVGTSSGSAGSGVTGRSTSSSGVTYGVDGQSDSSDGRGVRGHASSPVGFTRGVLGSVSSPFGFGVISYGATGTTGQKNFIQPHPTDPSKEIRFTSLEGNESGTYFRGKSQIVGGRLVIDVPEEFRLVSVSEGMTVQLTPVGAPAIMWVESMGLNQVVIRSNMDVEFCYMVNGLRRGFSEIDVFAENNSFIPEHRGVPFGTQYPDAYRQILVESGILNPDFTPNEVTAKMLGWTLTDRL